MKTKKGPPKTLLEYSAEYVEPLLFDSPDDDSAWKKRKEQTRNKIFGPDVIGATTLEYSILEICDAKGIMLYQWEALSLSDRGKLMAFSILKNKVEMVREWERDQKEVRKKHDGEAKQNAG